MTVIANFRAGPPVSGDLVIKNTAIPWPWTTSIELSDYYADLNVEVMIVVSTKYFTISSKSEGVYRVSPADSATIAQYSVIADVDDKCQVLANRRGARQAIAELYRSLAFRYTGELLHKLAGMPFITTARRLQPGDIFSALEPKANNLTATYLHTFTVCGSDVRVYAPDGYDVIAAKLGPMAGTPAPLPGCRCWYKKEALVLLVGGPTYSQLASMDSNTATATPTSESAKDAIVEATKLVKDQEKLLESATSEICQAAATLNAATRSCIECINDLLKVRAPICTVSAAECADTFGYDWAAVLNEASSTVTETPPNTIKPVKRRSLLVRAIRASLFLPND